MIKYNGKVVKVGDTWYKHERWGDHLTEIKVIETRNGYVTTKSTLGEDKFSIQGFMRSCSQDIVEYNLFKLRKDAGIALDNYRSKIRKNI